MVYTIIVDEIIPEPIGFEWDEGNIDKNLKKHGVTVEEAEDVFYSKPSVLLEDEKHSGLERRYLVLGKSENGKFLSVTFTLRKGKVRIISSRPMSRKERRLYAEKS